jgi:3-oxoacyl-[acyl-carrier protein] reductase
MGPPPLPSLRLDGLHALVCGASAGIGRASSLALAAAGADITVLARSAGKLAEVVAEARTAGAPAARAVVADLDDRAGLAAAIDVLLAEVGPVAILVNNTGGPPPGPLIEAEEDAFLAAFGRHVLASHLLVRRLLPGMVALGYGRIVNVISLSVREPLPMLGVSNTIRGAMAAWAKTLALELPPKVTINNVLPGYTATERLTTLGVATAARQGTTLAEVEAAWCAAIPEGRLGVPAELGAVVAFLASPAAAYVRGVSLPVDGGRLRGL